MYKKSVYEKVKDINDIFLMMQFEIDSVISTWSKETGQEDPIKDLYLSQVNAVFYIWKNKQCNLNELATSQGITKSSASTMVTRLVKKEVIIREVNPQNRREVILKINRNVDGIMQEIENRVIEWTSEVMSKIGKDDFNELYRIMNNVKNVMSIKEDK